MLTPIRTYALALLTLASLTIALAACYGSGSDYDNDDSAYGNDNADAESSNDGYGNDDGYGYGANDDGNGDSEATENVPLDFDTLDEAPEPPSSFEPGPRGLVRLGNERCCVRGYLCHDGWSFEYNGWYINYCCMGCDRLFQQDPDKYAERLYLLTGVDVRNPPPSLDDGDTDTDSDTDNAANDG